MRKRINKTVFLSVCGVIVWLFFAGCSQGLDRNLLYQQMKGAAPDVLDVDPYLDSQKKPPLPFPVKLAIYFDSRTKNGESRWDWDWKPEHASPLLQLEKELKNLDIVSEVFYLPESVVNGWQLEDIRQAASRYGANAVLIVNGSTLVDFYFNGWAALYPTFVGLWFAPGNSIDALFVIEASLWGTDNQYRYLTFEEESIAALTKPLVFARNRYAVSIAQRQAIQQLSASFYKGMLKLTGVDESTGELQQVSTSLSPANSTAVEGLTGPEVVSPGKE